MDGGNSKLCDNLGSIQHNYLGSFINKNLKVENQTAYRLFVLIIDQASRLQCVSIKRGYPV